MDLTFDNVIDLIATNVFGGSTTLAGLALLIALWAVCVVLCAAMKASPAYSVVPLIPLTIFFRAYGILDMSIMVIIVLLSSVLIAAEFKKVAD